MVDARQASFALRLPYYWFSDRTMRCAKRIPHYLLGGLVRFRMSELSAWASSASTNNSLGTSVDTSEDTRSGEQQAGKGTP
jgi:hypothetical protein